LTGVARSLVALVVVASVSALGASTAGAGPSPRWREGVDSACRADGRFVVTHTWTNDDVLAMRVSMTNDAPGVEGPTPGSVVIEPGRQGAIVVAFANGSYDYTRTITIGWEPDLAPQTVRMTDHYNGSCPVPPGPTAVLPPVAAPAPPPAPAPAPGAAAATTVPAPTTAPSSSGPSTTEPTATTTEPTTTTSATGTSVAVIAPVGSAVRPVVDAEEVAVGPVSTTASTRSPWPLVAVGAAVLAGAAAGTVWWRRRRLGGEA